MTTDTARRGYLGAAAAAKQSARYDATSGLIQSAVEEFSPVPGTKELLGALNPFLKLESLGVYDISKVKDEDVYKTLIKSIDDDDKGLTSSVQQLQGLAQVFSGLLGDPRFQKVMNPAQNEKVRMNYAAQLLNDYGMAMSQGLSQPAPYFCRIANDAKSDEGITNGG